MITINIYCKAKPFPEVLEAASVALALASGASSLDSSSAKSSSVGVPGVQRFR